jgi:uncharacterized protein (DUF58 family)
VLKRYGLSNIHYSRVFDRDSVFLGEEALVIEKIENLKLLPVPLLVVESAVADGIEFASQKNLVIRHGFYHQSSFFLPPFMRIRRKHKVRFLKRGCFYLTEAALNCCTWYGLLTSTKIVKFSTRIVVYPKLVSLEPIPMPSRTWSGDVTVTRWIVDDPFMIAGSRPYRPGDPLNRINWKATARTGSLHSHNTEFTASPKLMISLSFDINEEMWDRVTEPERIEKAISFAASTAIQMIGRGIETGLLCNGKIVDGDKSSPFIYIEPLGGQNHLRLILENLAMLTMVRSFSIYSLMQRFIDQKDFDVSMLVITPYTNDRMRQQLGYYKANGGNAEIIEI